MNVEHQSVTLRRVRGLDTNESHREVNGSRQTFELGVMTAIAESLAPSAAPIATQKAGRREWIGLAVLALPCLIYSMDLMVFELAVPRLTVALKPSSAQLLWIADIYGFILAGLLVPMGTLGDRIGRRKLLLIGAAAFGLASIAAAFTTSAGALIAARAVQGVAGATIAPSTLSLIRNMFLDDNERTTAIGVWITSYSIGGVIGPVIGGVLLDRFWWGSVLLIGVPVMVLLLAVGPVLLPEYRDPSVGRIDLPSAALSLAAVLLVIFGVKQVALANHYSLSLATIAAGAACGALFVRRQQSLAEPVFDVRLFRDRAFSAALTSYALVTLAAFGIFFFLGQYLQLVKQLSPLAAGFATLPAFLGFIFGSFTTPVLTRRSTPGAVMIGGLGLAVAGFTLLGLARVSTPLPLLVAAMFIYTSGLSPVFTLATDLIVGAAPPARAGAAAALSETSSELGGALGIALLGSFGTAVYRTTMTVGMPAGVPTPLADEARSTIGGAIDAANRLSPGDHAALSSAAREAFTHAMNATAWICVAILVATAIGLFFALHPFRALHPLRDGRRVDEL
jgi:MFS transporter, DHA2 family, multidrug resistance protein